MKLYCFVLLAVCNCFARTAGDIVPLNHNWTIASSDGNYSLEGSSLPSGIYTELEKRNIIQSVLKSYNDVNLRYLSHINWTYSLDFKINLTSISSRKYAILTFHGIDTVATIKLNDIELGSVDNMFVRYRFDVKNILREGLNHLEVLLAAPAEAAKLRANANNFTPPECPPNVYHGECHMNFLRKMQASFSWDWGPAVPSMGIWKSVILELYDAVFIRDITYGVTSVDDKTWKIDLNCYMETGLNENEPITGVLSANILEINKTVTQNLNLISTKNGVAISSISLLVEKSNVVLWWPNGYGKQKLYQLRIRFNTTNRDTKPRYKLAIKAIRIAFRTIELVQENVSNDTGLSFYFKINGINIFMKGSNWIPSSILPESSMNVSRIRHLLKSAKFSHMNMLRVWGGGIYEHDEFYDLADNYGILIWQDMMFACAMYPVHTKFLDSVKIEIEQNVRRLQKHPSIAVWAGNNENEAALVQNWYRTAKEYDRFADEYRELYINTLKPIIEKTDWTREYLSSSPSNGKAVEKDNWISSDPQDRSYGDIHYYNYVLDGWDAKLYPRPRFSSEYGFQSYPSKRSWLDVLDTKDSLTDLLMFRQHSPLGDVPIENLINKHLVLPNKSDPRYIDALIYFSQLSQAMTVKAETEIYRAERGGIKQTMGALYWQLNDVWIAPSWSGIDYYGQFKILHYWTRHFFAPIHVMGFIDMENNVQIHAIRDDLGLLQTYNLELYIIKWNSFKVASKTSIPVQVNPNTAKFIHGVALDSLFDTNITKTNSFIEIHLRDDKNKIVAWNYIFPEKIRNAVGITDPQIELKIIKQNCNKNVSHVAIQLFAHYPAVFIYLQLNRPATTRYIFSKNGFMQTIPTQIVHLEFDNKNNCSDIVVENDIKVMTVNQFMVNGV